jgi:hypothetical protein
LPGARQVTQVESATITGPAGEDCCAMAVPTTKTNAAKIPKVFLIELSFLSVAREYLKALPIQRAFATMEKP